MKLVQELINNEIEIFEAIHIRKNRNKNLMNAANAYAKCTIQLNQYF